MDRMFADGARLPVDGIRAYGVPDRSERGCLLELTWRGAEPITLSNGQVRRFLPDGNEVILGGRFEREGVVPIGFGTCRGEVQEANG